MSHIMKHRHFLEYIIIVAGSLLPADQLIIEASDKW